MSKNGIGYLLNIVDPKLVAGYEAKNLDGKTLSAVNEEYKAVDQDIWKEFIDQIKLVMFSILVGLILYFYLWIFKDVPDYIAFTAMVGIIVPPYFYFLFPVRWKYVKDNETRYRCEPILRHFRQSLEALDPHGMVIPNEGQYHMDSVRKSLVNLAVRVLVAEERFKGIRMQENVVTTEIIQWGKAEEHCREEFKNALKNAEEFGMTFSSVELFNTAKKDLNRIKSGPMPL